MKRRLVLLLAGASTAALTVALPAHHAGPVVAFGGCANTDGLHALGLFPGGFQVCISPPPPPK